MPGDENLLKRLRATFRLEAAEHIQAIASGLVGLEQAGAAESRAALLESTFRSAHSLKGAARTVNESDIASLCQPLESVFAALKRGGIATTPELFDLLHRVVDALGGLLKFLDPNPPAMPMPPVSRLVHSLESALRQQPSAEPQRPVENRPAPEPAPQATTGIGMPDTTDTVRVSTATLDSILLQAEELLSAKLASTQHTAGVRALQARAAEWRQKWTAMRSDVRALRYASAGKKEGNGGPQSAGILEFLDWNRDFFESLETGLMDLGATAGHDQRGIGGMVDNLLDEMKKIVVQPFSTVLDAFPRFVRELSREQGKEVRLDIYGGEIEIDRRILERMKDPLTHIIRNCIDHGIEVPARRAEKGKPPGGSITIGISQRDGGNVELLISDDGAGIDIAKLKTATLKAGLLSPEKTASLSGRDALMLACQTGISTSPEVTDISGRGLGLAIVKDITEKMNGMLDIESEPGRGTTFRITLPLTLARFRGIVVREGEAMFVLPTGSVERVARVAAADVRTVGNRETISLDDAALSLVSLGGVLALPRKNETEAQHGSHTVVVLNATGRRIAFAVDEILNEQEVLVKPLPKQLGNVRNISGATILSTGRVVPILNVPDLIDAAVDAGAAAAVVPAAPARETAPRRKSLLVAEDSITSRTLLKNILENAGYAVETAVDGIDAFTKLRGGEFDLLVSDVDMPRMNGFGLTAKIRADGKYASLPVILVTALDSREDREHGIDVGASAYIVKSSFDQSNLLETIQRLI